ncbi:histidinol-phosphate transaminase [Pelodictyon luteolum]|uniref:Histidinol-phosphate aminotransferase n=1 Tax=Chlorobium luteolum (strain DSM 273 / BCRC 81028 / 2530) TaxID=319225 RepID=HIS8_CHLL3|nr:histidinol-phosphate transaminase [Pelodictyon luteolum]Q3B3L3.1 RecName: Full=Histidinol-phosphate aminotransferase; AltName: Full=Imidazole acetol-phosphate transaminase [Pelodictyon luteolum DSM 273]ABB24068.1 histidinol phosphate aminotransferase apoenzyme [Pelodictyon luteolum DSM 273]
MQNDIHRHLNPALQKIGAYVVEGGQEAPVKLNQNESPFDVPMWLKEAITREFVREPWNRYPDILPYRGIEAYAEFLGVPAGRVIMGNGSNELLYTIFMACLGPGRRILIPEPSFSLYEKIALLMQADIVSVPMRRGLDFDADLILERAKAEAVDLIVLSTPNNPTGKSLSPDDIRRIATESGAIVLVDEAYIEFSRHPSALPLVDELPNVVILRTMSKALALAGMRIGFAIAPEALMAELTKPKIPFASNRLAEITLRHVLANYSIVKDSVSYILDERERMYSELEGMDGLQPFMSDTNFLIIRVADPRAVFQHLRGEGILVRNVSGYPLMEGCLRCNIGLRDENRRLLDGLSRALR